MQGSAYNSLAQWTSVWSQSALAPKIQFTFIPVMGGSPPKPTGHYEPETLVAQQGWLEAAYGIFSAHGFTPYMTQSITNLNTYIARRALTFKWLSTVGTAAGTFFIQSRPQCVNH